MATFGCCWELPESWAVESCVEQDEAPVAALAPPFPRWAGGATPRILPTWRLLIFFNRRTSVEVLMSWCVPRVDNKRRSGTDDYRRC